MLFIVRRVRRVAVFLLFVAVISRGGALTAAPLVGREEIAVRLRNLPAFAVAPEDFRRGLGELQAQVPDLVPLLLEVLSGKDFKAAAASATALGLLPARAEAGVLADVLLDPPLPERKVFELIGNDGTQRVQGYGADDAGLILALRQTAASALGRIGGATAMDALGQFFRNGDLYAARFLEKETFVDQMSSRILSTREIQALAGQLLATVAQELAATDPVEATEIFRKALKSPDEGRRQNAAHGLGLCARVEEAREVLIKFLQDSDTPAPVVAEVLQTIARALSYAEMRTIVESFSAQERCTPREFGLMVVDIATEGGLDRKPFQQDGELRALIAERMADTCYNVAARACLLAHRFGQDGHLLKALPERDLRTVAEHFVFFIMLGQEGSEPVLVEALEAEGNASMSDAYMLCGNQDLFEAATAWREDSKRNARAEETDERSRTDLLSWGVIGEAEGP